MKLRKAVLVTCMIIMAVGGISGVMLAGYTFITHAGS